MFALKNILKKIKRQSVDCDKIFATHTVHKGFASIIYKELLKLKKTNSLNFKMGKFFEKTLHQIRWINGK